MKTATRTAAPAKTRQTRDVRETEEVVIDFPQRRDVVTSPSYTFRIGAMQDVTEVQVSINGTEWQACRPAVGYWWFDWSGYSEGRHELMARARRADGTLAVTTPREFQVEFENEPLNGA